MSGGDWIIVDATEPVFGAQIGKVVLQTHGADVCAGPLADNGQPVCCIHNPSDHHMVTWPQNWRADRALMERVCPHGVGHPDPDGLFRDGDDVHGCDGCCHRRPADAEGAET